MRLSLTLGLLIVVVGCLAQAPTEFLAAVTDDSQEAGLSVYLQQIMLQGIGDVLVSDMAGLLPHTDVMVTAAGAYDSQDTAFVLATGMNQKTGCYAGGVFSFTIDPTGQNAPMMLNQCALGEACGQPFSSAAGIAVVPDTGLVILYNSSTFAYDMTSCLATNQDTFSYGVPENSVATINGIGLLIVATPYLQHINLTVVDTSNGNLMQYGTVQGTEGCTAALDVSVSDDTSLAYVLAQCGKTQELFAVNTTMLTLTNCTRFQTSAFTLPWIDITADVSQGPFLSQVQEVFSSSSTTFPVEATVTTTNLQTGTRYTSTSFPVCALNVTFCPVNFFNPLLTF